MGDLCLKIVNISLKNGIMPKEFYWSELRIDCLNEALDKAQPNQPQNFQIFAPQMPLNTLPLCVALHVENQSETEKELKILKHLSCDCSMKKHRLRKDRMGVKCPHGSVVELRPAFCKIKAKGTVQLEMVVNYNLLGQQEIDFSIISSNFSVKLRAVVQTLEFDPASMLITKQLFPVAISSFPMLRQTLWLYNPYSSDIKLRLISGASELVFVNDDVVVGSHQLLPLFVTFTPNYVGHFELPIEIVFNRCKIKLKINGECTRREQDLLYFCFQHNSPNNDLNSQLNPFVLQGDNVCIALQQNGFSSDNTFGLQNNSKNCIKFEWDDVRVSASSCEVCIEPKQGYLKPGFTKLFRVLAKSLGLHSVIRTIPIRCTISQYHKGNHREYWLPDGYFEYTDQGFYEKPSNWSPKCLEYLQSVYLSVNIAALNSQEIDKYAAMSKHQEGERSAPQVIKPGPCQRFNLFPLIAADGDVKFVQPESAMSDDEHHMMETLIRLILTGSKYESKQKLFSHPAGYTSFNENQHENPSDEGRKAQENSLIPEMINDILFDCIADISKEHRFIPSAS